MRLIDADEYKKRISHYPNIKPIAFKELRYVKTFKDYAPIKHGHWNKKYYDDEWFQYCCSHCNGITIYKYPFCPHCGTKMDEVEDGKTD